jgi:hypothetical protein
VASELFDPVSHVIDASQLVDCPVEDAINVILLDSLCQASDRGPHNLLRVGVPPRVVSIDYATGLQADFGGGALADVRVNPLVEPRARSDPAAFTQTIDNLAGRLTDASIADAIARVPRQILPSDDERERLRQGLASRRNVLPALLRQRYP